MVRDFFPALLPPLDSRDALTFAVRRWPVCGTGAKISSRASIMIVSSLNCSNANAPPAVSDKAEPGLASNVVN
jgi:hypothetical protein